ncbi:MAG: GTPase, partial [Comamonas sp.]
QMRLVYQIGQSYGYELDRGHIKDLLAALGVGLTSQYLEEAGRKLLSGLLGKAGKGFFGGVGRQAVSSGMSFASTYALGHVANQYYAGGRTLSTDMLKDAYQHVMKDGRELQARYLPQMQETARGLNTAKIMAMVRGA